MYLFETKFISKTCIFLERNEYLLATTILADLLSLRKQFGH